MTVTSGEVLSGVLSGAHSQTSPEMGKQKYHLKVLLCPRAVTLHLWVRAHHLPGIAAQALVQTQPDFRRRNPLQEIASFCRHPSFLMASKPKSGDVTSSLRAPFPFPLHFLCMALLRELFWHFLLFSTPKHKLTYTDQPKLEPHFPFSNS